MSEKKQSKVFEILSKEYKYESVLLTVISIIIMIVSAYIMNGTLTIEPEFPVLGSFPLVTAIVFFVAGFVGLVVGSWPIFKPSFKEVKRLTPPSKKTYADHTVKVFTFILGLTAIFLIFDTAISSFFGLFI
ncbi:preprotein translocase subunit SecE [Mycoplasmatota bacterium WC44]